MTASLDKANARRRSQLARMAANIAAGLLGREDPARGLRAVALASLRIAEAILIEIEGGAFDLKIDAEVPLPS